MSEMVRYLLVILIMALVTYIPRSLPITLFNKPIKSKFIKSFLYYVPYAVLASLTFPAILSCTSNMLAAITGTVVAIVLAYFEQSLVVVALAAVLSIFVTNFFI